MIRWRRVTHDDFYPSFAEPADGDTSRFVVSLWDNLVPRHGIVIAVAVRYAREVRRGKEVGCGPCWRGIPGWFIALFVIVAVAGVGTSIWRFSVLRSGGLNPFIAREQLESRLNQSQMMSPPAQPAGRRPSPVASAGELAGGRAPSPGFPPLGSAAHAPLRDQEHPSVLTEK